MIHTFYGVPYAGHGDASSSSSSSSAAVSSGVPYVGGLAIAGWQTGPEVVISMNPGIMSESEADSYVESSYTAYQQQPGGLHFGYGGRPWEQPQHRSTRTAS